MTYVSNNFNSSLKSNKVMFYAVEVITYNGESFMEEVEAHSPEEAQEIAAAMYDDVDYTMVQACYAGW